MTTIGRIKELWRYPVKAMAGESVDACLLSAGGLAGDRQWALRDEARREIQSCKTRPELLRCSARHRGPVSEGSVGPVDITFPDGSLVGSDNPDIHTRLSALSGRISSLQPLRPAADREFYQRYKADATTWLQELAATFEREPWESLPDLGQLPPVLVDHVSVPGTFFLVAPLHILTTATLDTLRARNASAQWDARRFRPNILIETDEPLAGLLEQSWVGHCLLLGTALVAFAGATARCGAITRAQPGLRIDTAVLRTVVRDADQNAGIYAQVEQAGELRVGDPVALLRA